MVARLALILLMTATLMVSTAVPAVAGGNGVVKIGPLAGSSNDGGSCGNSWAADTYTLSFAVKDNGDGTFNVGVDYKDGTFVTIAGVSPGACSTANNHGTSVAGGIAGTFQGWVNETVTGTFNPNGCAVPANCSTRSTAIAALFPGGVQSDLTFNFEYSSNDKSLTNRHWQDKGTGKDAPEAFVGDIAK